MVAVCVVPMVPVVAPKVAVVAPWATVTEPGTVNSALLSLKVTLAPPAGAALVSVTVQVLVPFDPQLVGLHDTEDIRTEAAKVTVVFAEVLL